MPLVPIELAGTFSTSTAEYCDSSSSDQLHCVGVFGRSTSTPPPRSNFARPGIFAGGRNHEHRAGAFDSNQRARLDCFPEWDRPSGLDGERVIHDAGYCPRGRETSAASARRRNLLRTGADDRVAAAQLILHLLFHRRTDPRAEDVRLAGLNRIGREEMIEWPRRSCAAGRAGDNQSALRDPPRARAAARDLCRSICHPRHENASAAIGRNQAQRGLQCTFEVGMIRPDLRREAAEFAVSAAIARRRPAVRTRRCRAIARLHGFVEQIDDFLFRKLRPGAAWTRCDRPQR